MSTVLRRQLHALAAAVLGILSLPSHAQDSWDEKAVSIVTASESDNDFDSVIEARKARRNWRRHDSGLVSIGHDSVLPAGEEADAVVSIFGSSTTEGEVRDAVVSVLGNTRVSGPVGDAVVAVLGNVYINSKVGGDAVAVMGNVELGPQAEVEGEVVVIGGTLQRDPAAVTHGPVSRIVSGIAPKFSGLQAWIKHCLLYGRPLALEPGLGWAWGIALGFLAFYILLALMFRDAVDRCVKTLETQPGRSTVAALLTLVLTPVAYVVLCFTVIGIALVPFLWIAMFCAGLFGKTVILGAIGKRLTRYFGDGPLAHTAFAVLLGGAIALALYLVPFAGFIIYKLLGILGLGVVVYTLILAAKAAKRERAQTVAPQPAVATAAAAAAADTAAAAAAPGDIPAAEIDDKKKIEIEPAIALTALPRAGFWIRMGALAIDVVLIAVLATFINVLDYDSLWLPLLGIYGVVMWKLRGTTIGGIVLDLRVVRLDGQPIDWATAIVRGLGCFLSLIVAGLGFIWIAIDDGKQGWHDKIAGTIVVRAPKGGVSLL